MTHPIHHMHKRKRFHVNLEPYPHPDKLKRVMDRLIYVIGILGPVMTLPQIVRIHVEKSAAGVSLFTWSAYTILGLFWLAYGILHKEKPIILTYTAWLFIHLAVVVSVIMYP